jgi:hypothetical protein
MQCNMNIRLVPLIILIFVATGCASLLSSATRGFAEDLASAILDNDDIEMVRDGAPSYLILIDSLVARSPEDVFLLRQSATLNSAYAEAFVDDLERARLLHAKAKRQAQQAACIELRNGCDLDTRAYRDFERWLANQDGRAIPVLYTLGSSWAGWIQANGNDYNAIADLARVKAIMLKVAEQSPDYENGSAYLYLGMFETILPPGMGGRPELGREYFEQAIERSGGQNLLSKVMFAEQYARLVFDRELHDDLLQDVMSSEPRVPGLTLMNSVAREQAQQLMESADDYF